MSSNMCFRKPNIEDADILRNFLKNSGIHACDYSPANIILWSEVNSTEICYDEDTLFIRYLAGNEYHYSFPITKKSLHDALDRLTEFSIEKKFELKLGIIEKWMFDVIEKIYPGRYKVEYKRDYFDYVYEREKLAKLSGKKYHGKKNHINKFKKTYDKWEYEAISDENIEDCIVMVKEWFEENESMDEESKRDEKTILMKGFKYYKELGLKGGVIRAGKKIVALTMGEELNNDTFVIHFEKAFANVQGAYPMINQQFVINELENYKYVNREEDLGIEGLRKAKESYNPAFYVEKGVVYEQT